MKTHYQLCLTLAIAMLALHPIAAQEDPFADLPDDERNEIALAEKLDHLHQRVQVVIGPEPGRGEPTGTNHELRKQLLKSPDKMDKFVTEVKTLLNQASMTYIAQTADGIGNANSPQQVRLFSQIEEMQNALSDLVTLQLRVRGGADWAGFAGGYGDESEVVYGAGGGYGGYGGGGGGGYGGYGGGGGDDEGYGGYVGYGGGGSGYGAEFETKNADDAKKLEVFGKMLTESTDKQARKKIIDVMRATVQKQFEARTVRQEKQLKALESRLTQLRSQLQQRRDSKDEIVELRVKTLVNEHLGLGF